MAEVLGTDPGTGISGFGTTVQGASTGPIGMLTKVTIEGAEVAEIDVTTMNALGRWMKFVAGLKDAKEITLEIIYEKVNMGILLAAVGGAVENWTVTFPDGSTYVNSGFIKKVGVASPHNDKITQPVTLRLVGPPTFHVGS